MTETFKYDHLDRLDTILFNNAVSEMVYDAFGPMGVFAVYEELGSFTGTPKFDRGYTGHEHLCTFGLINMKFTLSERSAKLCLGTAERSELGEANGRVCDPVMCCFLSVDTYVQDPGSPQNFNRYAYCLNNPLRYVDPSGELFWVIPNIGYSKDGGLSFGLTFVSGGYSFRNEQAFASVGITAGLSPYSGVPISTNYLTLGASCDLTYSKATGVNVGVTGNLSAWSYNTTAKSWNYNPSVSVMVCPEHTTNLIRGQGFRSNDQVLQRFVANNQHQQALDYFGFEGRYDSDCPDPGITDRKGLTITYGDQAFENGFDFLYFTADHEQRHLADFKSDKYKGFDGPLDDIAHAEEEWSTYLYNYRRQGLYIKHGLNLRDRIEKYGIGAGVYDVVTVTPHGSSNIIGFAPKWYDFVYYIPRLY